MDYTVVIRTLGKAGIKYRQELDSLMTQTIPPKDIVVYIAEGYPRPKETCGKERYVYVKKGMVAQRALPYEEVTTEWILFLDDDVYLPPNAVSTLFKELQDNNGDVIAPCTFWNHKCSIRTKIIRSMTGREVCRFFGSSWAYKVLPTAGFSYLNNPRKGVYESQTNAGPCFLCRKADFLSINFQEESWLDDTSYALPDDQVMFYKMYLRGLRLLTSFDSGIIHLDAGSTINESSEKQFKQLYSEYRNKYIFWYRFLYSCNKSAIDKLISIIGIAYAMGLQTIKYRIIGGWKYKAFSSGLMDGMTTVTKKFIEK